MPATRPAPPVTRSPLGSVAAPGRGLFEAAASLSSAQRAERLEVLFRLKAQVEGEITLLLSETG